MNGLKERLEIITRDLAEKRSHMIAGMIKPTLLEVGDDGMSATLGFPCMEWEQNPNGVIHGGIIATMIDTAIGLTTIAVTQTLTPTISLQISYLRPCPSDGTVAVRAHITMLGGSIIHTRAEVFDTRTPDTLVATAEGTFRLFKTSRPYLELL